MSMTEKQKCVVDCLYENVEMPTKEIIKKVNVSKRYVQRIRKWYRENVMKGKKMEEKNDVFDTCIDKGIDIDILNMANEGEWSIQQISLEINASEEAVRNVLLKHYNLLTKDVLDEESSDVYFFLNDNNVELPVSVSPTKSSTQTKEHDDFWEVKIDCVDSCGKAEKEVNVFMNKVSREKSMKFMK